MKERIYFVLNPFIRYPLVTASIAFIFGIIVSVIIGVLSAIILIIVFSFSIYILIRDYSETGYFRRILLFVLFFLLGVLRVQYFHYKFISTGISYLYGQEVNVLGVISGEVERYGSRQKFTVRIVNVDTGGEARVGSRYDYNVLINTMNSYKVEYQDRVVIKGVMVEPPEWEDFSYKEYLLAQRIFGIIETEEVEVISKNSTNKFLITLKRIKYHISSRIDSILPQPHASLLCGIVFGAKSTMSVDLKDQLKRTGTTHIIAVSGYNITVLVSMLCIFSSLVGRRRLSVMSVVFIFFFMFFVGADNIPVVRASLMGGLFMFSQIIGKKRINVVLLPFLVALLLLENPMCFKLVSFQLSFASTLGLIVFGDVMKGKFVFIPEFAREDTAATIAAILCTLPITLFNFGQVSIIAPLVNFLVLPVVPFITIYGFILMIVAVISPTLAQIGAYIVWICLEYTINIISLFGRFSFSMLNVNPLLSSLISKVLIVVIILVGFEILYNNAKNIKQKD